MSSIARYRSGPTNPIAVKCDPNYPIEVGDLLFQDPVSKLAKPASAMKNQGSEALNQSTFHDQFLGVALQKNGAQPGEVLPLNSAVNHSPANTIEAATTGDFEFDCAASAWNTVPAAVRISIRRCARSCPMKRATTGRGSSLSAAWIIACLSPSLMRGCLRNRANSALAASACCTARS